MAQRNTFWMISSANRVVFYLLAVVAVLIFVYGFYRRIRLWRKGRREKVRWSDVSANFRYLWTMAVQQQKIRRDKWFGYMHRFTSYGFVILFIGTVLVVVDYDLKIPLLRGGFYLLYKAVLDIVGVLFLIGLLMAIRIRAKKKRSRLWYGFQDHLLLWLLFAIGAGGYVLEGIRLAVTQVSYGVWSPVGYSLSILFRGAAIFGKDAYPFWWFTHAVLVFTLIAVIPYTKLLHLFTAPIHILFQPVKRTGKISLPYHLHEMPEQAILQESSVRGVSKITDFTGWQLLSTDACTECGRCDSQCPAHLSAKPLSPRSIVTKIRDNMAADREILSFISPEELQSCTTCGACVEACPVSINHIDLILSMRRGLIYQGVMQTEEENTLLRVEEQHNVWGKPWSERADWSRGLNIPVLERIQERDK